MFSRRSRLRRSSQPWIHAGFRCLERLLVEKGTSVLNLSRVSHYILRVRQVPMYLAAQVSELTRRTSVGLAGLTLNFISFLAPSSELCWSTRRTVPRSTPSRTGFAPSAATPLSSPRLGAQTSPETRCARGARGAAHSSLRHCSIRPAGIFTSFPTPTQNLSIVFWNEQVDSFADGMTVPGLTPSRAFAGSSRRRSSRSWCSLFSTQRTTSSLSPRPLPVRL